MARRSPRPERSFPRRQAEQHQARVLSGRQLELLPQFLSNASQDLPGSS